MIRIISRDDKLIENINKYNPNENIQIYEDITGLLNVVEETIIIDSEIIKYEELTELMSNENVNLVYIVEKENDSIDEKITQVTRVKDKRNLAQKLTKAVVGKLDAIGNVIGIIGSTRNVGTTMIAQSVAKHVKEYSDINVVLLSLTLTKGLEYCNEQAPSFNVILRRVENKVFSPSKAIETLSVKNSEDENKIGYMRGMDEYIEYTDKDVIEMIRNCAKAYDLVILDMGSVPTEMMISGISQCETIYVVSTANIKALDEYKEGIISSQLNEGQNIYAVLNKTDEYEEFIPKEVEKILDMPVIASIPLVRVGYNAECEKKLISEYSISEIGSRYKKALLGLIESIARKSHIVLRTPVQSRRNIFKGVVGNDG